MTEARFGHYGLPALVFGIAAVAALLLHLLVPYAHVNPEAEGQSSFVLDRGEASDTHDDLDMVNTSSPGLTLTGAIILTVAAVALLIFNYIPMNVAPARWAGWTLGAVGSVGGLMAFASSMLWVGSGVGQAPAPINGADGGGIFGEFGGGGME